MRESLSSWLVVAAVWLVQAVGALALIGFGVALGIILAVKVLA